LILISDHVRRWTSTKFAALHTMAALMVISALVVSADKLTAVIGGLSAITLGFMGANTVAGLKAPPSSEGA